MDTTTSMPGSSASPATGGAAVAPAAEKNAAEEVQQDLPLASSPTSTPSATTATAGAATAEDAKEDGGAAAAGTVTVPSPFLRSSRATTANKAGAAPAIIVASEPDDQGEVDDVVSNSLDLSRSLGSSRGSAAARKGSPLDWSRGSGGSFGKRVFRRLSSSGHNGAAAAAAAPRSRSYNFDSEGSTSHNHTNHNNSNAVLDRSSSSILGASGHSGAGGGASQQVRRYIKRMSSLVADPVEIDVGKRRLEMCLRECGEMSLGVASAIAVWRYDEDSGRLVHPPGGWWRSDCMKESTALARLEDSKRQDHVPPKSVPAGVDIAGILWTEYRPPNKMRRAFDSGVSLKSMDTDNNPYDYVMDVHSSNNPIRWRDLKSLVDDPDSAKGPRLALMEEAGFVMAAGVRFNYRHHQGMVIFLTTLSKDPTGRDDRLSSVASGAYLHQAAQFVGAALSLSELRRAALAERHRLRETCFSMHNCSCEGCSESRSYEKKGVGEDSIGNIAPSALALVEEGKATDDGGGNCGNELDGKAKKTNASTKDAGEDNMLKQQHDGVETSSCFTVPSQVRAWANKMKGGGMQVPPSLSLTQSMWTILGSFVGLLVLSALNEYYSILSNEEYFLLIGPFGALMTLQYGLTAAPASQPRNAVLGQAVAGATSLAFTYIPEALLPTWLRRAVGPALGIGLMVKFGVTHPPAGAHAVLYASGKYNFGFYALVVLSTAISVIPATVVNNMSVGRQYPTYWGFVVPASIRGVCSRIFHDLSALCCCSRDEKLHTSDKDCKCGVDDKAQDGKEETAAKQ